VHPRHAVGLALCPTNEQVPDFQEVATKVHDIQLDIVNRRVNSFGFAESWKDIAEFKSNVVFSKNLTKEAMSNFKVELVPIIRRQKLEEIGNHAFQGCNNEVSHAKSIPREEISIP